MTVTRCASSHLMTELLTWRNPQGSEENWAFGGSQGVENGWEHAGKVISTELCLVLLTVTAVVETVAYAALALASLALYPCTDKPFTFFVKLLQSSSFTILWALGYVLIPFIINLRTHESFARQDAARMLGIRSLYRDEDYDHVEGRRPVNVKGDAKRDALLDAGATFIQQDVLAGASKQTIGVFSARNLSVRNFILGKAVYIYAFGAKKNEEIPNFFKQATKDYILSLRQENKEEVEPVFTGLVSDPAQFNIEPQTETAQSILDTLKELLSNDPLDPLIDLDCWGKAANQINDQINQQIAKKMASDNYSIWQYTNFAHNFLT